MRDSASAVTQRGTRYAVGEHGAVTGGYGSAPGAEPELMLG